MPEAPAPVSESPASDAAFALLRSFARLGVLDVVVCPGSRSQALALAAAALADDGVLRLHVRLDERGAGFLALGLGIEAGVPALVVTTSGTAVANLHPAVLEAHHSRVPLVVLSADRPVELRGIRANQTTAQPGIFGSAVRLDVDVDAPIETDDHDAGMTSLAARAIGAATDTGNPGPVHLNLQYREPLSSGAPSAAARSSDVHETGATAAASTATVADHAPDAASDAVVLAHGPRTVVIAGHGSGEQAEAVARAGAWPLLAEVSSGARFGPQLVVSYRELLSDEDFGGRIERAVVFGHPTLSREVPALLRRDGVETIVVNPSAAEGYDPGHRAVFAPAVDVAPHEQTSEERRWTGRWVATSRALRDAAFDASTDALVPLGSGADARREFLKVELAAVKKPVDRRMLVEALWNATWPHDRLVFGASRLIRDADRVVPGKRITVHSNRGLAGIDGTVATALGIAVASQAAGAPGITRVLLGDLTLLHDAGSLLIGDGETRPRVLIVVGNDGGGTIFDTLEVAASAPRDAFDRVLYTPQSADLEALAGAFGWEYRRAENQGRLTDALTAPVTGPTILEIPLQR
ncbi:MULTISPECIES: 2-succinyl-5-enolpyruvyl-6-hydroxy-3-cyclohexene-1-carboxylic-acid synthase [unclassified Leifsonia]|uniref:2-succinyl-5-enolpyruvyl-6-hydroxy-3- cyclohexene-1-carboxylic-acid synthase n=1 Tax=unclassified Leifsonia TaxID=2663824 RepID=UPI0006F901D4|nr:MULTISPECIES: 2-succinyl-5-enolpyruvyl-6-hydroxy-3-cyclohexene-1-carboxylic-acid synthase [unclassified Leifsonia]KQX05340.1 2-succinyl-5-enolpyruvyl-6-hydroxy-3-cyclohexene-1-carboxylate synthase [Leifsonia sp. Root1293]KRA08972.1 2-succinyl-5-enolpyruvyl-6-hydroxy-3-cyclohexene-1-carboxylate synthase [Leifsonia sp. Root60]